MKKLISLGILAVTANFASAFYFPGWPSASRPPSPVLVQTFDPVEPTSNPPVDTPYDPPTDPNPTPEPATIVMAGIGLAIGYRRWTNKN